MEKTILTIRDEDNKEYRFEKPNGFACELLKVVDIGNGQNKSIIGAVSMYDNVWEGVYFELDGLAHQLLGEELRKYRITPIEIKWYERLDGTERNSVWCKCWTSSEENYVIGRVMSIDELGRYVSGALVYMHAEPLSEHHIAELKKHIQDER